MTAVVKSWYYNHIFDFNEIIMPTWYKLKWTDWRKCLFFLILFRLSCRDIKNQLAISYLLTPSIFRTQKWTLTTFISSRTRSFPRHGWRERWFMGHEPLHPQHPWQGPAVLRGSHRARISAVLSRAPRLRLLHPQPRPPLCPCSPVLRRMTLTKLPSIFLVEKRLWCRCVTYWGEGWRCRQCRR